MSTSGPTKGVDANSGSWATRPFLAGALRFAVLAAPTVASFLATHFFTRWLPIDEITYPIAFWWMMVLSVGFIVLVGVDRIMRRALPLVALFKLSLVFPDKAPSRFSVAMRTGTTKQLERQIEDIKIHGMPNDATRHAELMLQMVAALSVHDRLTRGHCERVRAYTDMISEEMGLGELDAAKLRWAALLHDVGKLFVPSEILNKEGRPTDDEWEILKSHTWQGDKLVGPLKPWLGEWAAAVGSHHERWDGDGYPNGLKGEQIHIGARIVAVADTFDVITSKRSYKPAITADKARAEIARCAGSQFDPRVARAFLNIGLGRLRFAIGPLSWLANLPAAGQAAVAPVASPLATAAVAMAATGAAVVSGNTAMLFNQDQAPEQIAFVEETPTSTTTERVPEPTTTSTNAPSTTTTDAPTTTTDAPTTTTAPRPAPTTTSPAPTTTTAAPTTTTTAAPEIGPSIDDVSVSLNEDGQAVATIQAQAGTAPASLTIIDSPSKGTATVTAGAAAEGQSVDLTITYVADANKNGADDFAYKLCDTNRRCATGTGSVTIAPVNDAPTIGSLANLSAKAGDTVTVRPVAADIDTANANLSYNVVGLVSGLSFSPTTGEITGTITPGTAAGANTVTVTVRDNGSPSLSATTSFTLQVVNANAPTATAGSHTTTEDNAVTFDLSATTYDGDLTVSVVTPPTRGSLGPIGTPSSAPLAMQSTVTASVTYTPNANANGPDSFTFQVCDRLGRCATATVSLTVTPVNDSPIVTASAFATNEDTSLTITDAEILAFATDVEGSAMFATWSPPSSGSIVDNGNSVTFTPVANASGSVTLPFQICDADGGCTSATTTITVNAVNDAPVLSSLANRSYALGDTVSITPIATDIENDTLTYTITNLPAGLTYSSTTGAITGTVGPTQSSSTFLVTVSVADSADSDSETFTITIVPGPIVMTADSETLNEDGSETDQINGTTEVGTVSFTLPVPPSNGAVTSFTSQTPVIPAVSRTSFTVDYTYVPDPNFHGTDSFVIRGCDTATGTSCTDVTVNLTINSVNDSPTIASIANQSVTGGIPFSVTALATDVDGDNLTFSATNLLGGLSINPSTGEISGTPSAGLEGQTVNSTITVTDDGSPTRSHSTNLRFNVASRSRSVLAGSLLITEVQSNSSGPTVFDEFIEIYNNSATSINLSGLRIGDYDHGYEAADPNIVVSQSFSAVFPSTDADGTPSTLAPGQYATIWITNPTTGGLGVPFPTTSTNADLEFTMSASTPMLDDGGDEVWLTKGDAIIAFVGWDSADGYATNQRGGSPIAAVNLWNATYQDALANTPSGVSISLASYAGFAGSACWELTASGTAQANGCAGASTTLDTDAGAPKRSPGVSNII